MAFMAWYFVLSLLLPPNTLQNGQTNNQALNQPVVSNRNYQDFQQYLQKEFIPVVKTSYPKCGEIDGFTGLVECIALKDTNFDFDKIYAIVDDQYKPQILPMYWAKVYQYHNFLSLPAKDQYALEGKRQALKFWVQNHRIESPKWCDKLPEQALRQECLKMIAQ